MSETKPPAPRCPVRESDDAGTISELIMMEKTTYIYCQGGEPSCQRLDKHVSYTDLYAHLVEVHGITMPMDKAVEAFENVESGAQWADEP